MSRARSRAPAAGWLLACAGLLAAAAEPDAGALLARADASHDAFLEGVIRLHVVVDAHGKPPDRSAIELFVKGRDTSLCVFREGKHTGRKILTAGDKVWLIVPGAARPVPVSKTQRLMGAASFGDIARLRFAHEFDATVRAKDERVASLRGEVPCRVLELRAKSAGAAYPTGVLWTGRDDGLPRRLTLALASGKHAKDVRFTAYGGDLRLRAMEIRDLLAGPGDSVTSVSFDSYEKRSLDPAIFEPEGAKALP